MAAVHLSRRPSRVGLVLALVTPLALSACAGRGLDITGTTGLAATDQPRLVRMYVASTRPAAGEAAATRASFAAATVSLPPGHRPGVIERPDFTPESRNRHVVALPDRRLDAARLQQEVATQLSGRVGTGRDVLVFVHGYNVDYDEARWRLAQIVADSGFSGVPVLFTWPSRSQILAYGSDRETATASRDELERLLQELGSTAGVGRVHVLAHSMGTWLAMEALRQSAIAGRPDLNGHLGEVMLAAPDIDMAVFRTQMVRLGGRARVSVFTASDDRALSMSQRLAGDRVRLGGLDLANQQHRAELAGLDVRVIDLSRTDTADMFRHVTFAEAPAVVRGIGAKLAEPAASDAPDAAGQAESFVDPAARPAPSPPPGGPVGRVDSAPLGPPES